MAGSKRVSNAAAGSALLALATAAASVAYGQTQLPGAVTIYPPTGDFNTNAMVASLAGVVNRNTNGELLISANAGNQPNARFWLDRLKEQYPSVQSAVQSNSTLLLNQFASHVQGYVLFDQAVNGESVNIASSIAGVTNSIIIPPNMETYVSLVLGKPKVADARTMDYASAYATYGSSFNKDMIFHQAPSFSYQLRDYAMMNRGFVYWTDQTALQPYVGQQNANGRVFGWANSEFEIFKQASEARQQVVASNHNQSSSTTAKWRVPIASQKHHTPGSIATQAGKHYVAFVMSDGDNATWLTNGMGTHPSWFGSAHRGKFDMNWDFTPSLVDMNPVAHNWFYDQAADGSNGGRDTFVTAHGLGTTYPSSYPLADINGLASNIWASMAKADNKVLSILDNTFDTTRLDPILAGEQVMGMMYKTNSAAYKGRAGRVTFRNGKPIVSVRYSLWDKMVQNELGQWVPHGDGASAVDIINALKAPSTTFDPIDENTSGLTYSYSVINVHPWSVQFADGYVDTDPSDGTQTGNPMDNVWAIVQALQADGRFEIVGMEELIIHLRNHFGTPVQGAQVTGTWKRDASSNWGTTRSNWTGALPNFIDAIVNFGSGFITANRTVSVTVPVTAGTINFDNSAFAYTLGGAGTITLDTTVGDAQINVISGNHTISAPVSLANDTTITVTPAASTLNITSLASSSHKLTKAGAGTVVANIVRAGALDITAGTLRTGSGTSVVADLSIAAGAKLDLRNGKLIVTGETLADVEAMIDSARIVTTSTTANAFTTLGIASNADLHETTFGGVSVGESDVLVMYAYAGDANLSGGIDGDDFFQIDAGFASNGTLVDYYHGDFDHNGVINADDYFLIDANYAKNLTPISAAAVAVPEPACVIFGLVPMVLQRRFVQRRGAASV